MNIGFSISRVSVIFQVKIHTFSTIDIESETRGMPRGFAKCWNRGLPNKCKPACRRAGSSRLFAPPFAQFRLEVKGVKLRGFGHNPNQKSRRSTERHKTGVWHRHNQW